MDQLSTVEDVLSIRRNDRRHHIALNVQIVRIVVNDRYKFLTVAVKQFRNVNVLRHFSIKCWSSDFAIIEGLAAGDFVTFRRLWKKSEGRRVSGGYRLNANDLDTELFVWAETIADIVQVFDVQNIVDFESIRGPLNNARVAGHIHATHAPQTIVIVDNNNNLMEIESHNGIANYRITEGWTFVGNIVFDAGMPVMQANDSIWIDENGLAAQGGDGNVEHHMNPANLDAPVMHNENLDELEMREEYRGPNVMQDENDVAQQLDGEGRAIIEMDNPEEFGDLFGDLLD